MTQFRTNISLKLSNRSKQVKGDPSFICNGIKNQCLFTSVFLLRFEFVDEGNIDFRTYDAKYTQNSNWNFTLDAGDLTIIISQNRDLGANITGTAKINEGNVLVLYEDNNPNIGVRFEIPFGSNTDYHPDFPPCLHEYRFWGMCSNVVGFHYNDPDLSSNLSSVKLTSLDFLENRVKYYYDLRFEIFQGSFNMGALTSIN